MKTHGVTLSQPIDNSSIVDAGDSLVTGAVVSFSQGRPVRAAVRPGSAGDTAVPVSYGTELFCPASAETLF